MLSDQTIQFLAAWLKLPFASHLVDHVLMGIFVHYGDDIADYFEFILKHNDYSVDEANSALQAVKFLLDASIHLETRSRPEVKRRNLRARILDGEFGRWSKPDPLATE
jgi:hypothetical protein